MRAQIIPFGLIGIVICVYGKPAQNLYAVMVALFTANYGSWVSSFASIHDVNLASFTANLARLCSTVTNCENRSRTLVSYAFSASPRACGSHTQANRWWAHACVRGGVTHGGTAHARALAKRTAHMLWRVEMS